MSLKIERDEITFDAPVTFNKLAKKLIATFRGSSINALNIELFKLANTAPTNVATIQYGQDGQTIYLLGDGFTTLTVSGNIKTRSGGSMLLDAAKIYALTFLKTGSVGYWYCHQ
jgi:hypothetical protein